MKIAVSKRTASTLKRVLDYIKQEPDRLDMNRWGTFHDPETRSYVVGRKKLTVPPCGTTGCLAGTVLLVTKKGQEALIAEKKETEQYRSQHETFHDNSIDFPSDTDDLAQSILRISEKKAGNLFYFRKWGYNAYNKEGDRERVGWPEKFTRMYNSAKNGKERFTALKARVNHFIRTGE